MHPKCVIRSIVALPTKQQQISIGGSFESLMIGSDQVSIFDEWFNFAAAAKFRLAVFVVNVIHSLLLRSECTDNE